MDDKAILDKLNELNRNTLMDTLNIVYTEVDSAKGIVKATMPVNSRVHQPFGLLHGGASVALAESLGSASSWMYILGENKGVVGLEISANHIRTKKEGVVTGIATIIHKGRKTHLWQIRIEDEEGKLISLCKLTNMIIDLEK